MAKSKAKKAAPKKVAKGKPAKKAAKGAKAKAKAPVKAKTTAKAAAKKSAAKPAAKKPAAKKAAAAKPVAKKAAKPAAAPSPTKRAADAYAAAVDQVMNTNKPTGPVSLGGLRLENYRKPFTSTLDKLSDAERTQLSAVVGADTLPTLFGASDESQNEMAWLEYMDVVDTNNGTIVANLLIWPYGDGAVVHHGTTKMIASIVQHGISPHETTGKAWMADFAKAWVEGAPRLGVSSPNHFGFDSEQTADADDE